MANFKNGGIAKKIHCFITLDFRRTYNEPILRSFLMLSVHNSSWSSLCLSVLRKYYPTTTTATTTTTTTGQRDLIGNNKNGCTIFKVIRKQLESHDSAELVTQKATLSVFPETNVLQIIAILILETEIFPKFFV